MHLDLTDELFSEWLRTLGEHIDNLDRYSSSLKRPAAIERRRQQLSRLVKLDAELRQSAGMEPRDWGVR